MITVVKFRKTGIEEEDLREGRKIYNSILEAKTFDEKEDKYEDFYYWKEWVLNNYSEEKYYELCRKARGM